MPPTQPLSRLWKPQLLITAPLLEYSQHTKSYVEEFSITRHPSKYTTSVTYVIVCHTVRTAARNENDKCAVTRRGKSERML